MSKLLINQSTLSSIGDAIRTKNGTTDPIPVVGLADAILAIESGKAIVTDITGPCDYFNYQGRWDSVIADEGNTITFTDITNVKSMFEGSKVEFIPDIDLAEPLDFSKMFKDCINLEEVPNLSGVVGITTDANFDRTFANCHNLRTIPQDYFTRLMGSTSEVDATYFCYMFYNCYSLRQACDLSFLTSVYMDKSAYFYTFENCYSLDEVVNFPVLISSALYDAGLQDFGSSFLSGCYRLKRFTFAPVEDNYADWRNMTLDLSSVGYGSTSIITGRTALEDITGYNSGITADKEVYDSATYQALKNDPDWFSQNKNYSRYNKASAIETINSLPKLYTGGNPGYQMAPAIKFSAAAGSLTDGGAIGDLTEEEIAVAVNKNWTVAFE